MSEFFCLLGFAVLMSVPLLFICKERWPGSLGRVPASLAQLTLIDTSLASEAKWSSVRSVSPSSSSSILKSKERGSISEEYQNEEAMETGDLGDSLINKTGNRTNQSVSSSFQSASLPMIRVDVSNTLVHWNGFLTALYFACRMSVILLGFRHNSKPLALELQDVFDLNVRGLLIWSLGDFTWKFGCPMTGTNEVNSGVVSAGANSATGNQKYRRHQKIVIAAALAVYTLTFESCPRGIQFSGDFDGQWLTYLILAVVFLTLLYVLLLNFHVHSESGHLRSYVMWFGMAVIYLVGCSKLATYSGDSRLSFHMHHQVWAFFLACLLRARRESSIAAQCTVTALFIHGVAVFGAEPLLEYDRTGLD